jgi:hypothetical protein
MIMTKKEPLLKAQGQLLEVMRLAIITQTNFHVPHEQALFTAQERWTDPSPICDNERQAFLKTVACL